MPARAREWYCNCVLCPSGGRFFTTHEWAGHKARLAMLNPGHDSALSSSRQQNRASVSDDVILEGVERLLHPAKCEPRTSSTAPVSSDAVHEGDACPRTSLMDALEQLGRVSALLGCESARLQALEHGLSSWSPAKSQTLLSIEQEVLSLRLKASAVDRNTQRVLELKRTIRSQCDCMEARVLTVRRLASLEIVAPRQYDCHNYLSWPIDASDGLVQVSMFMIVVCSVILMLGRRATSLMIGLVRIVVRSAFTIRTGSLDTGQRMLLDEIPRDPRTVLAKYNLSGKTTVYATCPECHFTHKPSYSHGSILPSYPRICANRRRPDSPGCGALLVRDREVDGIVVQTPIRPFLYHSVLDFVGALCSRRDHEELIDAACDNAHESMRQCSLNEVDDIFQGAFFKSFKGPRSDRLFVDRQGEGHLAFSLNIDFFNMNGNLAAGAATSYGIITLACLNLPANIRYKYENLHIVGIIPGPREPDLETINYFVRPLIDDMVDLWDRGLRLSRTAKYENGRLVRAAIVCVVCDLPAARKVAALANHRSDDFLCSVCRASRANVGSTNNSAGRRCHLAMKKSAEAWSKASTSAEQDTIFKAAGVRYSELWRLPYWDPTRQLVVDPMHNLLLGLVQDHFRTVLPLTKKMAKKRATRVASPAFFYDFMPVPDKETDGDHPIHTPGSAEYMTDSEIKDVVKLHKDLVLPLDFVDNDDAAAGRREALQALTERLAKRCRAKALEFVCKSLDIRPDRPEYLVGNFRPQKAHWAKSLASWRLCMPLATSADPQTSFVTEGLLQHVWSVIRETSTPAWVGSVPHNFGDPKAGKLKADEWRLLCTVYLPLALISRWGDGSEHANATIARRSRQILDHTMELVSAVTIACRRTTSDRKARRCEQHILEYIRTIREVHPDASITTNLHMATHVPEFMKLFGPTYSWWCFPYERLIGFLQRMPNNKKIGQLESTVHKSFIAFSRIKHWSSKPDCPAAIQECRSIYDRLYPDNADRPGVDSDEDVRMKDPDGEDSTPSSLPAKRVAVPEHLQTLLTTSLTVLFSRHRHNGVIYSTEACHPGNSLVLVRPGGTLSTEGVPGVIEDICLDECGKVVFVVRLYMTLVNEGMDPFRFYPNFPARAFSAALEDRPCIIHPQWVVCHFARYRMRPDTIAVLSLSRD